MSQPHSVTRGTRSPRISKSRNSTWYSDTNLSAAEMKNLYMMIDTTKEEVRVMGKIEELTIMGYGQPAMRLRPKRRGQDDEQLVKEEKSRKRLT